MAGVPLPETRLYGPYNHGGRSYYQWMARGPPSSTTCSRCWTEMTTELDGYAAERLPICAALREVHRARAGRAHGWGERTAGLAALAARYGLGGRRDAPDSRRLLELMTQRSARADRDPRAPSRAGRPPGGLVGGARAGGGSRRPRCWPTSAPAPGFRGCRSPSRYPASRVVGRGRRGARRVPAHAIRRLPDHERRQRPQPGRGMDGGIGSCDVVTARALASLAVVAEYAAPLLRLGRRSGGMARAARPRRGGRGRARSGRPRARIGEIRPRDALPRRAAPPPARDVEGRGNARRVPAPPWHGPQAPAGAGRRSRGRLHAP